MTLKPLLILSLALALCGCKTQPIDNNKILITTNTFKNYFSLTNNKDIFYPTVTAIVTNPPANLAENFSNVFASNFFPEVVRIRDETHREAIRYWLNSNLNATWTVVARWLLGLGLFAFVVWCVRESLSERVTTVPDIIPTSPVRSPDDIKQAESDREASEKYLESLAPKPTPESLASIEKAKENLVTEPSPEPEWPDVIGAGLGCATEPPLKTKPHVIRRQILTKLSKKVSKRKKK